MTTLNEYAVRANSKDRGYGYAPVNAYQEGMVYHHMHLNGDSAIGIWIPKPLHQLIYHNSVNGHGMKDINKIALLWLASQSTILDEKRPFVEPVVEYDDDQFIEAVISCLRKTTVTSAEVALELGCKREYAKSRLKELATEGRLIQVSVNTTLCFKLPSDYRHVFEIQNEVGETIKLCNEGEPFEFNGIKFLINRVEE